MGRKILVLIIVLSFITACKAQHTISDINALKQTSSLSEPDSDFTIRELCYINNKALSYILESNDIVFDAEFFTEFKFDKNNSFILYQKMSDSILQENLKYLMDSMDNMAIQFVKNDIKVLDFCNSTQMSAHFISQNNQTNEHQLSATSKYKSHFSISDIVQIRDLYYIFCEYSEYFNSINEIEKSILGFQFRKCKNNGFIKFENFLEWHGEMVGHLHFKLFTIKNDSIMLNDIPKSDRFHSKAGFYRTKIKSFECE